MLIFDEVVTGFRFAYGGAQELYGVTPDIATLGKIIGGGSPRAAIAGRAEIMAHFDKSSVGAEKWLMQLGTLSGNPVAAVAGLQTMEALRRPDQYDGLRANGQRLMDLASAALTGQGAVHRVIGDPTLLEIVFTEEKVRDYRDVVRADTAKAPRFNAVLTENRMFKSPGKTYPSPALTEADFNLGQGRAGRGRDAGCGRVLVDARHH